MIPDNIYNINGTEIICSALIPIIKNLKFKTIQRMGIPFINAYILNKDYHYNTININENIIYNHRWNNLPLLYIKSVIKYRYKLIYGIINEDKNIIDKLLNSNKIKKDYLYYYGVKYNKLDYVMKFNENININEMNLEKNLIYAICKSKYIDKSHNRHILLCHSGKYTLINDKFYYGNEFRKKQLYDLLINDDNFIINEFDTDNIHNSLINPSNNFINIKNILKKYNNPNIIFMLPNNGLYNNSIIRSLKKYNKDFDILTKSIRIYNNPKFNCESNKLHFGKKLYISLYFIPLIKYITDFGYKTTIPNISKYTYGLILEDLTKLIDFYDEIIINNIKDFVFDFTNKYHHINFDNKKRYKLFKEEYKKHFVNHNEKYTNILNKCNYIGVIDYRMIAQIIFLSWSEMIKQKGYISTNKYLKILIVEMKKYPIIIECLMQIKKNNCFDL